MRRVHYVYTTPRTVATPAQGIRARVPLSEKIRDRGWLRASLECGGLFLFGFGATGLLLHFAAGFLVSGGASFLRHS